MYICIYVYMYICIYVYMYICIYIYRFPSLSDPPLFFRQPRHLRALEVGCGPHRQCAWLPMPHHKVRPPAHPPPVTSIPPPC